MPRSTSIYTEGHTATSGQTLARADLSTEAIRLGRTLVELMPDEPEASGLLALMLLTESRRPTRTAGRRNAGAAGRPGPHTGPIDDQRRSRTGAECLRRNQPGPFQIQAAIAAVHADAPTAESTDWSQIIALYDHLYALRPNPVVVINRSVAIAELHGPVEGPAAPRRDRPPSLPRYQPSHAARADLLKSAGRRDEAAAAYDRAIALTTNPVERNFLVMQQAAR